MLLVYMAKLLSNLHSCQRTTTLSSGVQSSQLRSQLIILAKKASRPRALKRHAWVFEAPCSQPRQHHLRTHQKCKILGPHPSSTESQTPGVGPGSLETSPPGVSGARSSLGAAGPGRAVAVCK